MRAFVRHPATIVWIILMAATCLSGWLAETDRGVRWATVTILLVASVKTGLIMHEFMELKSAPLPWRVAAGAWLLIVTSIVLAAAPIKY